MIDPIVEEVRNARAKHAKRFGYNLDAICADLQRHQLNYRDRLVRLKPKKIVSHSPGASRRQESSQGGSSDTVSQEF